MRPHIATAHTLWKALLKPGDTAIDATCGNGHDSLYLSSLLGEKGDLHCIDIQEEAINATREKVPSATFHLGSHATLPNTKRAPRLIVYNLGYLPKGDHALITKKSSTLESLENALRIADGIISITCYSGHPGGDEEEEGVIHFAKNLPSSFQSVHYRWVDKEKLPSLLVIYGKGSESLFRRQDDSRL